MKDSRLQASSAKHRSAAWFLLLCLSQAGSAGILYGQSQPTPAVAPAAVLVDEKQASPSPAKPASIGGSVVDKDGAVIANAKITLTQEGLTTPREAISGGDGSFLFADAAPGSFQLTCSAPGFAPQQRSGVIHAGESIALPQIELEVGLATVDVEVTLKQEVEIAEQQIHVEEKQRLFGAIPNFYVSYVPNAVPLTTRQKFELAWKSSIDPVSFGIAGVSAGLEQASNSFSGYGQGAQGYGKRFGATYADFFAGTFIGSAVLPSVLKQDPRYFYKGAGSKKSRVLYALANAFICKGDNGLWQPNYSNMLGALAAGGISNIYYPASNRGARLTFENALIGIGGTAVGGVIQELFLRRVTPHVPDSQSNEN